MKRLFAWLAFLLFGVGDIAEERAAPESSNKEKGLSPLSFYINRPAVI